MTNVCHLWYRDLMKLLENMRHKILYCLGFPIGNPCSKILFPSLTPLRALKPLFFRVYNYFRVFLTAFFPSGFPVFWNFRVISDIADQTNLLALNAAIEAARAGDAGRGFAVVADEVRKLAEKTMASTNDVRDAITSIQNSAQQSVDKMGEALVAVEEATTLANESGAALHQIVGHVERTADQVRIIATASEEQSAASEEITRSLTTVNEMSAQTTQAMNEAAQAIAELAQQTERLTALIVSMEKNAE